jgi:hypothetical protein
MVSLQLIHVYAKNYEGNGRLILIRLVRYSLDGRLVCCLYVDRCIDNSVGLILSQASPVSHRPLYGHLLMFPYPGSFLSLYGGAQKDSERRPGCILNRLYSWRQNRVCRVQYPPSNASILKHLRLRSMTHLCRAQYEDDDIAEANVVCRMLDKSNGDPADFESDVDLTNGEAMHVDPRDGTMSRLTQKFRTLRLPAWINFSYSTIPHRARHAHRSRSNPFGPP